MNIRKDVIKLALPIMGTAAIDENYIAGSIGGLINIPGSALSITATTLVGYCVGKNEYKEAQNTIMYLIKLSSLLMLLLCIPTFPAANYIASIYTESQQVAELAASITRVFCIATPVLWTLSFLLPSGLRGAGDAKYTMVVSIISMWISRITLAYVLSIPLKMGLMGVWAGMYVDWMVRGIFYYIRLYRGKWKTNSLQN